MSDVWQIYIWQGTFVVLVWSSMNLFEYLKERNEFSSLKQKFEKLCEDHDMDFHVVGKDSKNHEIFYFQKFPDLKKPYVAILSGLHGNEPGGPYGVYEYLTSNAADLPCNLFVMPLMNPHGFNRHIRRDANQNDLNRQWSDSSRKLIRKLKKLFSKQDFDLVLSLHEDDSVDGFYTYGGKLIDHEKLKIIAKILKPHIDPIEDGEIYGDPVYGGIVEDINLKKPKHAKSLEYFFDKINIPNITVEISGKLPLDQRTKIYKHFLTKCLNSL